MWMEDLMLARRIKQKGKTEQRVLIGGQGEGAGAAWVFGSARERVGEDNTSVAIKKRHLNVKMQWRWGFL